MNEYVEQLSQVFHLTKYEARLYLAALDFEHANLTQLARRAGLPRTAAYAPIKNLLREGLLSLFKKGKRVCYKAEDPKNLSHILDRKRVELENVVANLKKRIDVPERKLVVSYYPGRSGSEMAADVWLDEARTKEGKTWEMIGGNIKENNFYQLQNYVNRRVKKGIKGEMILAGDADDRLLKSILSRDKEELRKTILVDPKKYPFDSAIGVLDDSVMILNSGDEPFTILIRNKAIANTFRSIHSMFWDRYGM